MMNFYLLFFLISVEFRVLCKGQNSESFPGPIKVTLEKKIRTGIKFPCIMSTLSKPYDLSGSVFLFLISILTKL